MFEHIKNKAKREAIQECIDLIDKNIEAKESLMIDFEAAYTKAFVEKNWNLSNALGGKIKILNIEINALDAQKYGFRQLIEDFYKM